jgi:hypothetical protein
VEKCGQRKAWAREVDVFPGRAVTSVPARPKN